MKPVIERLSDGRVLVTCQDRRKILERQGPHYYGVTHQRKVRIGQRGQMEVWDNEGGGDFFDMTQEVSALLREN